MEKVKREVNIIGKPKIFSLDFNQAGGRVSVVGDSLQNLSDKINSRRLERIDEFCAVFMARTGLPPEQCELIGQMQRDGSVLWQVQKRNDEIQPINK